MLLSPLFPSTSTAFLLIEHTAVLMGPRIDKAGGAQKEIRVEAQKEIRVGRGTKGNTCGPIIGKRMKRRRGDTRATGNRCCTEVQYRTFSLSGIGKISPPCAQEPRT